MKSVHLTAGTITVKNLIFPLFDSHFGTLRNLQGHWKYKRHKLRFIICLMQKNHLKIIICLDFTEGKELPLFSKSPIFPISDGHFGTLRNLREHWKYKRHNLGFIICLMQKKSFKNNKWCRFAEGDTIGVFGFIKQRNVLLWLWLWWWSWW